MSSVNYPLVNAETGAPITFRNYASQPANGMTSAASTAITSRVPESFSLVANPFLAAASRNYTDGSSASRFTDQQAGELLKQAAAATSTSSSLLEPTPLDDLRAASSSRFQDASALGMATESTSQQYASYTNPNPPISVGDPLRSSLGPHRTASATTANVPGGNSSMPANSINDPTRQQPSTSQPVHTSNSGLLGATESLAAAARYTNNLHLSGMGSSSYGNTQQLTGRPSVILYMPCDDAVISAYQCLARQQMELFEANEIDVEAGAQGRNRGIVIGQVGIRCRHCAHLYPRRRTKSSTFYPSKLKSIYQTAQNMANTHLTETCQYIPANIREELHRLSKDKKTSAGGGKEYWSDGASILGIYETDTHLRFNQHSDYPGSMRGAQQS